MLSDFLWTKWSRLKVRLFISDYLGRMVTMLSWACSDFPNAFPRPRLALEVWSPAHAWYNCEVANLQTWSLLRGILLFLRRCWDPGFSPFLDFFYCYCFETGFYYVTKASLKLKAALLPQDPTCLDYRGELACPAPLAFLLLWCERFWSTVLLSNMSALAQPQRQWNQLCMDLNLWKLSQNKPVLSFGLFALVTVMRG